MGKVTSNKACDMNRWANGTASAFCPWRDILGKGRVFVTSSMTWRGAERMCWRFSEVFVFLTDICEMSGIFLVLAFSCSVVSLAWLNPFYGVSLLRATKAIPNEYLELHQERKSEGFFEEDNDRTRQNGLLIFKCSQASKTHLQHHLTSDFGFPSLTWKNHWPLTVRWKLMKSLCWRGKYLQLWSLSVR